MGILLFVSCNLNYVSPIPDFPVYLRIDMNSEYTTFWQNPYQYRVFEKPRLANERVGYSGIVVFCDIDNVYYAYDLCCPNEQKQDIKIIPNDIGEAVCEECGEVYNLTFGMGVPTQGISKHPLKRYNIQLNKRIITVVP